MVAVREAGVALVFGHSSGLGLSLTAELLQRSWSVAGVSRRSVDLTELAGVGPTVSLSQLEADLAREDELLRVVDWVRKEQSAMTRLFYCAGQLVAHPIDSLDYGLLEYSFRVNAFAPMILESCLLPLLKANGTDIVNVTSSSLVTPYPALAEYSASKAALAKFTKDLRAAMVGSAGRVLEFCPSGFRSSMYSAMLGEAISRDETLQMSTEAVAKYLLDTLDLPLPIDVEYIQMNRKNPG